MSAPIQANREGGARCIALLACPFCGGPGEYNDVSIRDEDWPGANGDWWMAGCVKCGIWLPQCEYATKQQAAEAWNTRQANEKLCNSPEAADSQGEKGTGSK